MLTTQQLIADILDNDPNSSKQNFALGYITLLSRNDENRAALCSPELGLAKILKDLLAAGGLDMEGLRHVVTSFAEWAALKENKGYLCREEFGLSKLLFDLIDSPDLKDSILIFFVNCALEPENHAYLLSEKLGIAMYLDNKCYYIQIGSIHIGSLQMLLAQWRQWKKKAFHYY